MLKRQNKKPEADLSTIIHEKNIIPYLDIQRKPSSTEPDKSNQANLFFVKNGFSNKKGKLDNNQILDNRNKLSLIPLESKKFSLEINNSEDHFLNKHISNEIPSNKATNHFESCKM